MGFYPFRGPDASFALTLSYRTLGENLADNVTANCREFRASHAPLGNWPRAKAADLRFFERPKILFSGLPLRC